MLQRARDLIPDASFGRSGKPRQPAGCPGDTGARKTASEPGRDNAESPASAEGGRYDRLPPRFEPLRGRITEISGPAALEVSCRLLREVQQRHRAPLVWILSHRLPPFAPDLLANGVDPRAIPFVFASCPLRAVQAAERCLRSAAFETVLLDLQAPQQSLLRPPGAKRSAGAPEVIDDAALGRLLRLCERAQAALLVLTARHGDLAGSLVFTRFATTRHKRAYSGGGSGGGSAAGSGSASGRERSAGYEYRVTLVKSKTGRPGAVYCEVLHGPYGML